MKILIIIFGLISINITLSGADYYVSNSGNDSNSGTNPDQAWATIAKVNSQMSSFGPGDNIYFERGSVFDGTLEITSSGSASNLIRFGAYGSGVNPVIKGSKQIAGWSNNGNVWTADCDDCPDKITNIFLNNEAQILGRYPNNSYLTVTSGIGRNVIIDNNLSFPDGYWNNAEVALKTAHWIIDVVPISSQVGTRLNLQENATYNVREGYGYFFQNDINTLDSEGEWAYNSVTKKLHVYLNSDPNSEIVEITYNDYCLKIEGENYLSIENLTLNHSRNASIFIKNSNYLNIQNNNILNSGINGIEITYGDHILIENNTINSTNNNGIIMRESNGGKIINNLIKNTSIFPGRGENGNGQSIALLVRSANDCIIEYNNIDSTGFNGISFGTTQNILIKNNLVDYSCLTKADGAGIYTWGNQGDGNKIIGNIVLNSIGNFEGTDGNEPTGEGIYIDDNCKYVEVSDNTTAFCFYGLYIHAANNIKISNNTSYENSRAQLAMRGVTTNGLGIDQCETINNKFFASGKYMQWVLSLRNIYGENSFHNNSLSDPFDEEVIYEYNDEATRYYHTVKEWQQLGNVSDKPISLTFAQSGLPDTTGFIIFDYNPSKTPKSRSLSGTYRDLENNLISGSIEIEPYSSIILLKEFRSILGAESTPSGQMEFCQGAQSTNYSTIGTPDANNYEWQISPASAGTIDGSSLNISIDWNPLYSGTANISFLASGPNNFNGLSPPLQVNILPKPHQPGIPNGPSSLFQNAPQSDYLTIEIEDATSYDWKINPPESGRLFPFGNTCGVEWNEPFFGTAYVSVRAENDCGVGLFSDSLKINVQEAELAYGIINIFTPNGDGFNDYWSIPFIRDFPDATIKIFDRSNRLLIEYNGLDSSWNGTINGELVPMGSYLYVIDLKTGKPPIKGYVTVLR